MPLDSTMVISMTTVMEKAAARSNLGAPKCSGETRLNHWAVAT